MQVVRVLLAGDEAFAVSSQIHPRGGFRNGSAALPLCAWLIPATSKPGEQKDNVYDRQSITSKEDPA